MTTWFSELFGFEECPPDEFGWLLRLEGVWLHSDANGCRFRAGALMTPSLAELRIQTSALEAEATPNRLTEVVGDVRRLHGDPESAGSTFQVASQFNLLEMVDPSVTPEQGITGYIFDATQGPAAAMACAAGTVARNHLVPLEGGFGQTAERQIDCARELGAALLEGTDLPWPMSNGYLLLESAHRAAAAKTIEHASVGEIDRLRGLLRVGLQQGTEVTHNGAGHLVNQVYCSALPVAYGGGPESEWEPVARLVLEAAYEATLRLAALQDRPIVWITLLGGGVFGNPLAWILDAIGRAVQVPLGLDVRLVSCGEPLALFESLQASVHRDPGGSS